MVGARCFGVISVLGLSIPVVCSTACRPPTAPGSMLGEFAIEGQLVENTCGRGFEAPAAIAFRAELRRSGTRAYWKMGEAPRAQGTIDARGEFFFRVESMIDGWPADPAREVPACRFSQVETISGRLEEASDPALDGALPDAGGSHDAGSSVSALQATNTIDVSVVPGFDCSLALVGSAVGGQFATLPCRVSYRLEGARSR